jgi:nicotinamidase/pyrazinamidase
MAGLDFSSDTALLIADMLNDFVRPGGALLVPGAEALVPAIRRAVEAAHAGGSPVIYLCDSHRPDDHEFEAWAPHGVPGTWGAEIIPELAPGPGDLIVRKRRFSAFFGTELDMVLRERGVRHLVLAGVLTDICIYHTAVDAFELQYAVTILENAVAAADREDHEFALKQAKRLLKARVVRV